MKYRIYYEFQGYGEVDIEAESQEQAEDLFGGGEFENENEWSENTELMEIKQLN